MSSTQVKQKKSKIKLMHQYYGYTGFYSFLGSSMLKAIPLILLFIGGILAIHFFVIDVNTLLNIITDTFPTLGVLGVFLISESILGLIPPELFIAWASKSAFPPVIFINFGIDILCWRNHRLFHWLSHYKNTVCTLIS